MKVKDFWQNLCLAHQFNFFSGVPFGDAAFLFNTLSPKLLHFVPAVNESVALGIVGGVVSAGFRGAVIISESGFDTGFIQIKDYIVPNHLPVLFITLGDYNPFGFKVFNLTSLSVLKDMSVYMENTGKPTVLKISKENFDD